MNIVFSTDWHVADKGPRTRTDDYREAVFSKLKQIQVVCQKLDAKLNVCGGDVFDVKLPRGNTHSLVRDLIQTLNGYSCPTKVVVGNHDIYGDNHSTLDRQPLGVVLASNAMSILDDYTIEEEGMRVRLVGLKYGQSEYEDFAKIERKDEDILMVVAHCFASEQGGDYYGSEVLKYKTLAQYPIDVFAFGHWHIDQGVKVIDRKHFINIGALTRGSLAKDNLTRNPKCALLSFTKEDSKVKLNVQQVRLKAPSSLEIFDLDEKARSEAEKQEIEEFLSKLQKESNTDSAAEGIDERLTSYDLGQEVRSLLENYLERAKIEVESG